MIDPEVTLDSALTHGLTEEEYQRVLEILGRKPTYTELGIYSVMWSEHCSYKNSIAELKKLPRSGGKLLIQAGEENAGIVDIGDGLAVVFKIESHNHPSAVEPYQGAATGVGGIMRDIFTMGARPIAALNSLRFGEIDHPRTKYLMRGIVKGIGDYGNSFGVPTVAGEIYFDKCYNENPIVNAMAVGIVKHSLIAKASAHGAGNLVLIVGSSTGRDGIHGATFASEEISEESEKKRPSVQVGDPFTEKLLLEATLEAIKAGLVMGIQDMGAAGITCSTSEMSARAGTGMKINLDLVPVRESQMSAYEIMLSESQERMLVILKPENEKSIKEIFEKWELRCETIGKVTEDGNVDIIYKNKHVAVVPAKDLVLGGGAPVYFRDSIEPSYLKQKHSFDFSTLQEPDDYEDVFKKLITSLNICSKQWAYRQYDSMVRTNTISQAGDAAVVRIKGSKKALAMKTDCNSRYVYLNPYRGTQIAVAECARNIVCVGALPLAITNCLNFGNPYKPEIYWQFKESIRGMGDACRFFNTPVTGGNVSFYNESPDGPIYPTPVIGMIGELSDIQNIITHEFKNTGDLILLLGNNKEEIGGSEFLKVHYNLVEGDAPDLDLETGKRLHQLILDLNEHKLLCSAHDVSEGGIAISVAESLIGNPELTAKNLGVELNISAKSNLSRYLFGESQSMVVISCNPSNFTAIKSITERYDIDIHKIGIINNSSKYRVNDKINLKVEEIHSSYNNRINQLF
ncbi:MAG: phosphoribosylformylglycinamidine synthase subunit PurL [Ignavibacteriales bacterium]|nr:phosphoribosylformylglycinamidine synthase subunit PurL [Ignavibacteriales bacterium]